MPASSSGIWPHAIEPDVSIRYMMFGFTCAVVVLASGWLEMSVAASAGSVATKQSSVAYAMARLVRLADFRWLLLVMALPFAGRSMHQYMMVWT